MRAIPILVLTGLIAVSLSSQRIVADEGQSKSLTLRIAEDGKCKLSVESGVPSVFQEGKAATIKSLAGAQVSSLEDGRHCIVYDFAKVQNADDFKVPSSAQVSIDDGLLVLTMASNQRAVLPFPRTLKLPVETSVAVRAFAGKTLILQYAMGTSVLVASLHGEGSSEAPSGLVTVGWRTDASKGAWKQLLKFLPGDRAEQEFVLPDGDWKTGKRVAFSVGVLSNVPVAVERIVAVGHVPPSFGAQLEDRSSGVVVVRTVEGSAAAQAGIKSGDVLADLNGTTIKSAKQALEMLGSVGLGEEAEWIVKRFGRTQSLKVMAE